MSVSTVGRSRGHHGHYGRHWANIAIINARSQTFLIGKSHPTGVYNQPLILPSRVAGDAGDKIADILDG
jgi:hypothetical protein